MSPNEIDEGWTLYNKIKDYTRMVCCIDSFCVLLSSTKNNSL
jgi:hypothetical protein